MREGDSVARLGGDEFLVLVKDASFELMEHVARRISDRLKEPISLGLIEVYTGCSIGIALCPEHGDDLDHLIRCADTAMYVAKDSGKRTFRVFSPEMDNKVSEFIWRSEEHTSELQSLM